MEYIINTLQKFFIENNDKLKIGLSQFKEEKPKEKKKTPYLKKNEVKLSDLMRKS